MQHENRDNNTSVEALRGVVEAFVAERRWQRFHQPKNLAMSIAIEAAELMELFQWDDVAQPAAIAKDPEKMQRIREELSDVLAYTLGLANRLDIDVTAALVEKMKMNAAKYPVSEVNPTRETGDEGRDSA